MDIAIHLIGVLALLAITCVAALAPLMWTVRRILRPIDNMAKERDAAFRFSIGDFLCLFWIIQIPLAFVFQLDAEETAIQYWVFTILVWGIAPLVCITCARALSKAGILAGMHRYLFLGLVVPIVYYGLFPFIALSLAGIGVLASNGARALFQYRVEILSWIGLAACLFVCGLYSPWLVRRVNSESSAELQ